MRYDFPTIACSFGAGYKVYEVPDTAALNSWVDETFIVHDSGTAYDCYAKARKSNSITFHYFAQSQELLFVTEHLLADGRGHLYFWDRFFSILVDMRDVKFGGEYINLPPLLDDQCLLPLDATPEQTEMAQGIVAQLVQSELIAMPVTNMDLHLADNLHRELKLPSAITASIISACKQRGITVTTAWHAAVVLATKQIQAAAGQPGKTFSSMTNLDLRRYFSGNFDPHSFAICCYHTGLPAVVDVSNDIFMEIAAQLKHFYANETFSGPGSKMPAMPEYSRILSSIFGAGIPKSSTPVLSSLGVLDTWVNAIYGGGKLAVKNIWLADTMNSAQIEAFLWTWQGEMVLSGSCNASYYMPADVDEFLAQVKSVLLGGLNIDQGF